MELIGVVVWLVFALPMVVITVLTENPLLLVAAVFLAISVHFFRLHLKEEETRRQSEFVKSFGRR